MNLAIRLVLVSLVAIVIDSSSSLAAPPELPTEALVLSATGGGGRNTLPVDPVAVMLAEKWQAPKAGDKVSVPGGKDRTWATTPVKNGAIAVPPGAYAYVPVKSERTQVVILQASGHSMVYVNGEPRTGDVYSTGYVRVPVALREGVNDFLFAGGRGPVNIKLLEIKAPYELDGGDLTLPDLRVGAATEYLAAITVRNCTTETIASLGIIATVDGGNPLNTATPSLPPASIRKVLFRIPAPALEKPRQAQLNIQLTRRANPKLFDTMELKLNVVAADAKHKRTFLSEIDGSVQYYSVVPAKPTTDGKKPGLALTLHGAGVEAAGQAACYAPKPGLYVVAATNRRPYGFDWEDWGRLDAMEVLGNASRDLGTDPRRTYLTGHSMGGHGTWHLGVTFPDRFAAIAPSAGWVSMWSYAGLRKDKPPSGGPEILQRATSPSDTISLMKNLGPLGVYVLHGDRDDNVPVEQARIMRKELAEFHKDFSYYERPGAGHWWGDACVDWAPIFEFFSYHELPERAKVRYIDFRTANPRVSHEFQWLRIETQIRPLQISRVSITYDPEKLSFRGITENVARLSFDLAMIEEGKQFKVDLDDQLIEGINLPKNENRVWFEQKDSKWANVSQPYMALKGHHRNGAFKDAFRNGVLFVYGTKGTPIENAWALSKARYDAEVFWYRGNGSVDILPDTAFDPKIGLERNVILYGHEGMNAAWKPLLGGSPVQVGSGMAKVGDREIKGNDVGMLLVRPRPGSDRAMVAAVCGSGPIGLRLTDRLPYFASGVGYPDWVVWDQKGVIGSGYFGNDWKVASGESAWRKE